MATINLTNLDDTFVLTTSNSQVNAFNGNDMITVRDNLTNNYIYTSAGDDTVFAGLGSSTIDTGDGNDFVMTTAGTHFISTGLGDDTITVSGNSTIHAGNGSDLINLQNGRHFVVLEGGANDQVYFKLSDGSSYATIMGSAGNDEITSYYALDISVDADLGNGQNSVNLTYSTGTARITCGNDSDTIRTGIGPSIIKAGSGNNFIETESGGLTLQAPGTPVLTANDSVVSGWGNDVIYVGGGNDTVSAGLGNDTITVNNANTLTLNWEGGIDTVIGSMQALRLHMMVPTAPLDFSSGHLVVNAGFGNVLTVTGITDISQVTFF